MSDLNVQLCPETGICSIIKADGSKVDLMPDEVGQVRDASGNAKAIKEALGQIDPGFAEGLAVEEIRQVSTKLK
ncbi:MAG: hypothetical protein HN742_02690 [Lentisphaerae bacterium]|jgi:hypothetical protein|nr:hypothetical protein [Lentisphaerota bacterium]MBT5607505.1 hypothetical protein [Lentisphaerota bacterium]MBT7058209.1 hypothetical protein [Lentisphaerota bacterium]MBT7840746.1 hypothetical protein [Lentisphaerota bacterium]